MSKKIQDNEIAILTGTAICDNETFQEKGGFEPERDQYYFQIQQGECQFFIGFKDILTCLRVLEKLEEIPEIGSKWWSQMATLYGQDLLMIELTEKKDFSKEDNHEGDKIHDKL